ncbi:sensor domain-containing diguanylate cyclase [Halalkalibacter nanhaiisediminis]|uniref:Diguanylate cyclase (GGDEF)-like protein n=1 Tax=Halalkalibacter nanhaiisediminis TaxID=688079 RepID=A0A562Q839_9BACI|nr:sensor domain-containing diguanylate cyclase [Halalkalibacter nanhaiisediminis]TWI52899.1 diguanylate cyclase (GGDEF)-like protein [Halalkalibacter nanhaiisediminis]
MITYRSLDEAADRILTVLKDFIGTNTLFIATNDGLDNTIIRAFNRDEQIVKEGEAIPFMQSYCSLVLQNRSSYLYISDTTTHPLSIDMDITSQLGACSFIGVPIMTSTNQCYGTICAMDRQDLELNDTHIGLLQAMASLFSYVVELEQTTLIDSLTGLYNRNYLKRIRSEEINVEKDLVFLFIDIDDFKSINDTYGHDVGDQVLIEFAKRLNRNMRDSDAIIRMGGDEFLVIVDYWAETDGEVEVIAERIMSLMKEPFTIDNHSINLTMSIGISRREEKEDQSIQHLLKIADHNMYDVKKNGKSAYKYM